jgi:hypothetical protein
MPQINPFNLRLQVDRLLEQGQPFFAEIKVKDWLKEREQNPNDYAILFHSRMTETGSRFTEIELRRRDGQLVDAWLQAEVNRSN